MRLKILVKINSGRQEIEKISEEEYKVFLKSLPEDNKANLELIKILSRALKKEVKIIKGKKSRRKIVEVI